MHKPYEAASDSVQVDPDVVKAAQTHLDAEPREYALPDEPLVYALPDEPMVYALPDEPMVHAAQSPAAVQETWLNPAASGIDQSLGESIQHGEVVLCIPDIASEPELDALLAAAVAASDAERSSNGQPKHGRSRFAVSDLGCEVVLGCDEILLHVLDTIDDLFPSVYETLFRPCDEWPSRQPQSVLSAHPAEAPPLHLADTSASLRELYMAGELEWSEGEPAINVYASDGRFSPHTDHLALTVLIPLTSPMTDFTGGGTGFWSRDKVLSDKALSDLMDQYSAGKESIPEGAPTDVLKTWLGREPTAVLKPPRGSALIFGGDV